MPSHQYSRVVVVDHGVSTPVELLEDGPCSPLSEVGGEEDIELLHPPPVVGQVLKQAHLTPPGRVSLDMTANVLE